MSRNQLVLGGFAELREQLRRLPQELRAEGGEIVDDEAELARSEVYQKYPRRTGNLRERLSIETKAKGDAGIAVTIVNKSPHAWMFENGTQARHTKIGANRGAMPPGRVFIPTMQKHRRRKDERLRELVERAGLTVSGSE